MNSPINYSEIKAIIFDLGGVILNLDTERTLKAFRDLGTESSRLFNAEGGPEGIFHKYEMGKISTEEFLAALMKHLPNGCTAESVIDAWNAMLLDLPVGRLRFLRKLSLKVPVFLLSNTNEAHILSFENRMREQFEKHVLQEVFLEVYYSCRMGLRKPDPEIYLQLARKHSLELKSTLFIDDSEVNVKGAIRAGMQGLHLIPGQRIEDVLAPLLK